MKLNFVGKAMNSLLWETKHIMSTVRKLLFEPTGHRLIEGQQTLIKGKGLVSIATGYWKWVEKMHSKHIRLSRFK